METNVNQERATQNQINLVNKLEKFLHLTLFFPSTNFLIQNEYHCAQESNEEADIQLNQEQIQDTRTPYWNEQRQLQNLDLNLFVHPPAGVTRAPQEEG